MGGGGDRERRSSGCDAAGRSSATRPGCGDDVVCVRCLSETCAKKLRCRAAKESTLTKGADTTGPLPTIPASMASTLPTLLLLFSFAFAAPTAYRNDPHEHDLAGRRLVASDAAATTPSARLATPATPATTAALPPTTNKGCGVLNGATFRGESRKPIEAVFGGGGSCADAVLAARATYPLTVPDNTTQIHFLLALTFYKSGLARMVFQAEPCVKRFQCDTVRWSRATSRDDSSSSSSSMKWHGSREANGEAAGVDAVTIDPSDCDGLMNDPLLRSDLERDGGRFHLPCVGVGAEGPTSSGGSGGAGTSTVGRVDGLVGMSVRSICPNLPLLTAHMASPAHSVDTAHMAAVRQDGQGGQGGQPSSLLRAALPSSLAPRPSSISHLPS